MTDHAARTERAVGIIMAMVNAYQELRARGVEAPIRYCITEPQRDALVAANALGASSAGPTFRGSLVAVHGFGGYAFCTVSGLRAEVKS